MVVSVEQIRSRLSEMNERRGYYEAKAATPNRLRLYESWAHSYLAHPYLIGAPDERLAERFVSVFMNVMEIALDGRLTPRPVEEMDSFWPPFTHLLEEYSVRHGGPPEEVVRQAQASMYRYIEHGKPAALEMFEGYSIPSAPVVVKYGQLEHLISMIEGGQIRLSNASAYNNVNFNEAIRDDETSRIFMYSTYRERLAGKTSVGINGSTLTFGEDDIAIPLVFDDYYLFSLCDRIHHRMPTDFHANAALVIRDPGRFIQALTNAFLELRPDWVAMDGPVTYYDPYLDRTKFRVPEMAKHLATPTSARYALHSGRSVPS